MLLRFFSRPHIVLPKEHSLDAVFFPLPSPFVLLPFLPSLPTLCNSLKLVHAFASCQADFVILMYNDNKDLIHSFIHSFIQTAHKILMMKKISGPHYPARPRGGSQQCAPGGRACSHGAWSGTARRYDVGPPFDGLTTRGRGQGGWVQCELGSSRRQRPWRSDPRLLMLGLGTWNITSLLGKEPELVQG